MPTREHGQQYLFADIASIKAADDGIMRFSGYASTSTADLSNEVVEPTAFEKHLWRYLRNPQIFYNHDKTWPIGKAVNVEVTAKGLYMTMELFPDSPNVTDIIWPLIVAGGLRQMSIGFFSLAGEYNKRDGCYHHTEVYLVENSVVPIACNPDAEIGVGKTLDTLAEITKSFEEIAPNLEGKTLDKFFVQATIKENTSVNKENSLHNTTDMNSRTDIANPLVPDFRDITATECVFKENPQYDPEGTPVRKPYRSQKTYDDVHQLICAAKRVVEGKATYLFEIGYPTEKGFAFDWDKVAVTMCRLFGAKGVALFNDEEKVKVFTKLFAAYEALDKELPAVEIEGELVSVATLTDYDLINTKFQNVVFNSEEKAILNTTLIMSDLKNVSDIVKSWTEVGGAVPATTLAMVSKEIYAMLEIFGYIYTPEDADVASRLLNIITAPDEDDTATEAPSSAYDSQTSMAVEADKLDNKKVAELLVLKKLLEI